MTLFHKNVDMDHITFSRLVIYLVSQIYGVATLIAYTAHFGLLMKVCTEKSFVFIPNGQKVMNEI